MQGSPGPGRKVSYFVGPAVKALDAYLLLKARNYQFLQVQGEMCPVTGYISDAELMDAFLAGYCMFSAEAYTFTADLLAAYNQFRASRGAPLLIDPAIFSRQLNQFCSRPIWGKRRRINGANLTRYQGIALNTTFNTPSLKQQSETPHE